MEEIVFSRWLFEGRPRQGKNVLPDGLNWLCYFAGSSISHPENSISCIFLEYLHQVEMKSIVNNVNRPDCQMLERRLWYFTTLKTYRVFRPLQIPKIRGPSINALESPVYFMLIK